MNPITQRGLQVALSTIAGFGDTIGFLQLSSVYAAFMSGSSTMMGVALGRWAPAEIALPAAVVAGFVAGVMLGTLAGGTLAGGTLDRLRPVGVLLLVSCLMGGSAALSRHGLIEFSVVVLAGAMGTMNTVFNRPGHSGIGLTYMTGTLVRIGQQLSAALRGEAPWRGALPDLLLWMGLVAGAALGMLAFAQVGPMALAGAAAAVLPLAGVVFWATPARA